MPTDVLSLRALNRALLARQMLLRPAPLPAGPGRPEAVIGMVEHLVGLQAQAPFPPYFGLWSRLAGFQPADLAELLVSREVVRIALMRGTIHLVSARDCLTFRPLVQPVLDRALPARDDHRQRLYSRNGIFPGTVLVDGFVAGMWRLTRSRRTAVLTVEMFGPVPSRDRDALREEAERLLGFAAAGDSHEIRFRPSPDRAG